MIQTIKIIGRNLKTEIGFYKLLTQDKRIPKVSKLLIAVALFYLVSPIDLIPDCIPVIGHIDDLIIIPILICLALRFVPKNVIAEIKNEHCDLLLKN